MSNVNLENLQLSGQYCPECGYIHPVPVNGICPVANANKNKTQSDITYNKEEKNGEDEENIFSEIIDDIKNMLNNRFIELKFDNEYQENKFKKIIKNFINKDFKRFIDEYKK